MRRNLFPTLRDTRKEKVVVAAGDQLMSAMGFTITSFSQARATMQTPGIPDRLYTHIERKLAVWWEAKRAGRIGGGAYGQTPYQKAFQTQMLAVGWEYVLGSDEQLTDWAITKGLARRVGPTIQLLR